MADQNTAASTLTDDERKAIAQMPYEEARDKLIEAVQALEAGGLNLDQSMRQWEVGEALAQRCLLYTDVYKRQGCHSRHRGHAVESGLNGVFSLVQPNMTELV